MSSPRKISNLKYILSIGGYLKKNTFVEENAGIRENGYKTFQFNGNNLINMFFFLILPGTLFTYSVMDEMIIKDQQLGRKREYGLLPKDINNTKWKYGMCSEFIGFV